MLVIRAKNYEELSRKAAKYIANQVELKPNSVLGLATGSTPVGTYKELIRYCQEEGLSFRKIRTVNLDEYYGLRPDHEQSYRHFMDHNLFDHIDILKENTHVPDGLTQDPCAFGEAYDEMISVLGGIDLQLLGIGSNGHIAFNEPNQHFVAPTHLVKLSQNTLEDNARFFDSIDEVPPQAITMGMRSIMRAKRILILASGVNKAEAVKGMLEGEIDPMLPASILQLHPDVVLIADNEALSLCTPE